MSYFTVNYTKRTQPDSSAVDRAWYNEDNQMLYLELHGVIYAYSEVPWYVYAGLNEAVSPGAYYQSRIKSNYGPAMRLGPVSDMREVNVTNDTRVSVPAQPVVQKVSNNLTIKSDGSAEVKNLAPKRLPLNKDVQVPTGKVAYAHTVYFVTDEDKSEKSHTVKAASMDDAIEALYEIARLLNVSIYVKGVLVRFE